MTIGNNPEQFLRTRYDLRSGISRQDYHTLVEESILRTVAYGDVFDFPMTVREIFRYMIGMRVFPYTISCLLTEGKTLQRHLSVMGYYVCLRGRESLVDLRRQRAARSEALWSYARRYGRLIDSLPFVRMVAVTGSLAVNNPGENDDIDYLIVASPGRVWLCRSMTIAVVKWAAQRGEHLCPNYVLSEKSLWSDRKDIYTAHELAQLAPLSGMEVYTKMRFANLWLSKFLPNAYGPPPATQLVGAQSQPEWVKKLGENFLSGPGGQKLERWEMERKIKKFSRLAGENGEAEFSSEWCKGHFEGHAVRSIAAYQHRLEQLGLDLTHDRLSLYYLQGKK
jgi:hypothetical protein